MKTLIAGAGLAGLTTAAHLRACGTHVETWDPSPPGGRARSRRIADAWLNLGPHALPRKGHAARELARLGIAWSGREPRHGAYMTRSDGLHPAPLSPLALLSNDAFAFGARWTIGRTLSLLDGQPGQSVNAWLERIGDASARQMVRALVRLATYGGDLDAMDAHAACRHLRIVMRGVVYVDGGWQSLVDGLLVEAGPVTRRSLRGPRRVGASWWAHDGEREHAFDAVVLAMTPDRVRELVPDGLVLPETRAVRLATLDLVLRSLPVPDVLFAMGLDEPLYFSVHSASARLADDSRQVVHAARYLDGSEDEDVLPSIERYLDRLQPGWREQVLARRHLPNIAVHHGFPAIDRPRPSTSLAAGLFLAGDWVGEEGMLADAAMASGARVAKEIARLSSSAHRAVHAE